MTSEARDGKKRPLRGRAARTTPTAIERRERDTKCVQLRRAGVDWASIAQQLGYASAGHAHKQFMAFMKDYPREDAVAARELEADRYDQLQRAIWKKCLSGDTWAIDRVLKIMDQRERLLGLNLPPQSVDVAGREQAVSVIEGIMLALRTGQ